MPIYFGSSRRLTLQGVLVEGHPPACPTIFPGPCRRHIWVKPEVDPPRGSCGGTPSGMSHYFSGFARRHIRVKPEVDSPGGSCGGTSSGMSHYFSEVVRADIFGSSRRLTLQGGGTITRSSASGDKFVNRNHAAQRLPFADPQKGECRSFNFLPNRLFPPRKNEATTLCRKPGGGGRSSQR